MSAFLELVEFFRMALSADLGFDRRFFWFSLLVVFMTGNTIDFVFGMFAIDPSLKDPPGLLLMAGQTVTDLFLGLYNIKRNEKKKGDDYKDCFF
jgi:hypothetical protein